MDDPRIPQDRTAPGGGMRRRTFVAATLATAGAAMTGIPASAPAAWAAPKASGRRVAIFGGGMGGLSAAHELAERGFQVTVYERKAWGGKCRSIPVAGTGSGGRKDLPGEHGFRFFPGFYQNLPDTMKRVPVPGGGSAYDNLVAASGGGAFYEGLKIGTPTLGDLRTLTPRALRESLGSSLGLLTGLPPHELQYFLQKVIVFLTSGPKRRMGQWEELAFADFVRVEGKSELYRKLLVDMFTSTLVAAKPEKANTRTMGLMAEAFLYSVLGGGGYEEPDRLLNAPTNEALIDPWTAYLKGLGVRFAADAELSRLEVEGGVIGGAEVSGAYGTRAVVADHYVLAMPVERAVPVLNDAILALDPGLARLGELVVDWMNGIMIYLREPLDLTSGHVVYAGQPWALTSIEQAGFWRNDFAATYGTGEVSECLSIDVSAWDQPGILYDKAARDCTDEEIFAELLAQLRASLPDGEKRLTDANIHSYFIDPAITGNGTPEVANDEPLLINTPGSWDIRPEATTGVPNLFLASDYVRNNVNLATMEGANEAGRKAANAILEAAGSAETPAALWDLWQPEQFDPYYRDDDRRYAAGLPNAFDIIQPHVP